MAQETWTVRSLIRATLAKTFRGLMRNISRGFGLPVAHFTLDCPLADFTTGTAQLFLSCRQQTHREDRNSFAVFHFATHAGHFEQRQRARSGANGRNPRSCILAGAVYHSAVYCTAAAYCSQPPPTHLYIMVPTYNHKQTEQNIMVPTSSWCKFYLDTYCCALLYHCANKQASTDLIKHCDANIMAPILLWRQTDKNQLKSSGLKKKMWSWFAWPLTILVFLRLPWKCLDFNGVRWQFLIIFKQLNCRLVSLLYFMLVTFKPLYITYFSLWTFKRDVIL